MTRCYLTDMPVGDDGKLIMSPQCCCNCEFLAQQHKHCRGKRKSADGKHCGCRDQHGFACVAPEFWPHIYINWPQHSIGCECYSPRKVAATSTPE